MIRLLRDHCQNRYLQGSDNLSISIFTLCLVALFLSVLQHHSTYCFFMAAPHLPASHFITGVSCFLSSTHPISESSADPSNAEKSICFIKGPLSCIYSQFCPVLSRALLLAHPVKAAKAKPISKPKSNVFLCISL